MICLVDRSSEVVDRPRRTGDGYLVAVARVARTGIQIYGGDEVGRSDLKEVRVYRPPDEVFRQDSLHSYAHRPLTNDHPGEPVTAKNWRKYAIGYTGDEIVRDGNFVRVPLTLMDHNAIQAWEDGKKELSLGYMCDLKWEPGEYTDEEGNVHAYDAVQTNIQGNHLALVSKARGGEHLRIGDSVIDDEELLALIADDEGFEFLTEDFNKKHQPAGSSKGGQFAPSSGGNGGDDDEEDDNDKKNEKDDDNPDDNKDNPDNNDKPSESKNKVLEHLSNEREKLKEENDPEERKRIAENIRGLLGQLHSSPGSADTPPEEGDHSERGRTPYQRHPRQRHPRERQSRGGGKGGEKPKRYTSTIGPYETKMKGPATGISLRLEQLRRKVRDAAMKACPTCGTELDDDGHCPSCGYTADAAISWNEALHPRVPAGSPLGGQFTSASEAQAVLKRERERLKRARVEKVTETRKEVPTGVLGHLFGPKKRVIERYVIRTDSAEAITADAEVGGDGDNNGDDKMKFTVDGVNVEVPDMAAQVIQKALGDRDTKIATLTTQQTTDAAAVTKLTTDATTAATQLATKDAEIATLKKQVEDAKLTPAQLDDMVKARHEVITKAKSMLGDKLVVTGKTEAEIRRQVVDAALGATAKDWSDDQVKISFDTLSARPTADAGVRVLADSLAPQGGGKGVEDHYSKYIADMQKANVKAA